MDVNGKTAVVTGGGSGIGRGIVRALAGQGMNIVVADIEQDPMDEVVAELASRGTEAIGVRTDVSKLDQVEALAAAALDRFGAVHVLCNNAGVGVSDPVGATSLEDWRWTIDIDLWGPIHGVHVFLPIMERQGEPAHINSTASMAGLYAGASLGAYNVAKHGVVALMASLERDLRSRKSPITTSVLCPGPINTNISRHSVAYRPTKAKPKADGEKAGQVASSIQASLEQGMDPDEVGRLVLEAIGSGKFWVLTHPRWAKAIQKQLDAMNDDQTLTRG